MSAKNLIKTSLAILQVFILTGCDGPEENKVLSDHDTIPVKTITLQKEEIQRSISASGKFTTDDESLLSFKTGGVIKRIYVSEGDAVKKGQLLAVLDLDEMEAMVAQAEAAYEKAVRDHKRAGNLYRDSVATLEQYEDSKTALDLAAKQLKIAEFNLKHSEIKAPASGFILKKLANEGEITGPGIPVLMTNGTEKGNWFLKVAVSDREWAGISKGDKASVELDAYPGSIHSARVYKKSEGVDPFTGTLTVDLKMESLSGSKLAAGLFGKAKIYPKEKLSTWVIPYESLLDGDGNTGYVFVTNDRRTVKKIQVKIAEITESSVLVSDGLEDAGELIISGSAYLTENSVITVTGRKDK